MGGHGFSPRFCPEAPVIGRVWLSTRDLRTAIVKRAEEAIYRSSTERTRALDGWLWHYNHHRKHSALGHQPPIARLNERNQP